MLDLIGEANAAALIGLISGIALGLAARLGRFCTLGAIEDLLYAGDDRGLRMWVLAIGVAIIGTHLTMAYGLLDPSSIAYLDRQWNPLATVSGGLIFGYGMALAGNCGYGALARLGGGDLRAFVILLVMGLTAYIVMSGPLAALRVWAFPTPEGANPLQGLSQISPTLPSGLIVGTAVIIAALAGKRLRQSPKHIFWGVMVGAAIAFGWAGTGWVAATGFGNEPVESHSFAAPLGDTMLYLMTASGTALSFSVGSVAGVLAGAVLGSLAKGQFRWEACEDPRELRRQMLGGALMGAGAVLAMGCSVGQGLSAFAVLAFSAPVACIAIFAGAALGLRHLIAGFNPVA